MSGGQQQRVAVARAIVTNPALILADEPTGNLDTESSLDVMSVFAALHAQGRTVVLITHEEDIAAYAERVVKLRDGRIVEDYGQDAAAARDTHVAHAQPATPVRPDEAASTMARMALGGVTANKLRSALTMLGVLIGVSAVIILVAVGTGSSRAVEERINALGTNTLTVFNTGRFGSGVSSTGTQSQTASLTIGDVKQISNPNNAPDVESVSPVLSTSVTATYKSATYSTTVTGSTPSYLTASDYTVASGSPITSTDVARHAQVVDIGSEVASNLFATGSNPIGQQITLGSSNWFGHRRARLQRNERRLQPGRRGHCPLHSGAGPAHRGVPVFHRAASPG